MKRIIFYLFFSCILFCFTAASQPQSFSKVISLNGPGWRIAADTLNVGKVKEWFISPPDVISESSRIPWVIQDIFHNYHGVAWYWRQFEGPVNVFRNGRYILRFMAVDYKAEVWLNGKYACGHEGSETPFDADVTDLIVKGGRNQLVVRVLNPTYEPIDGLVLKDTPSGAKQYPFTGNAAYNSGGIVGDVDLEIVPQARITDVHISSDWKTGDVKVESSIVNEGKAELNADLAWRITDSETGMAVKSGSGKFKALPGKNVSVIEFRIEHFKLWSPDDPELYRLELTIGDRKSADMFSARFGFRDFRFEGGYFRLNGKRIFLNGNNFSTHFPVGFTVPLSEDMLRRDVINMKSLGFNFVRIPFGCPNGRILDLYDELGILVQQEHFGCWQIGDYGGYKYPGSANNDELLKKRFESSVSEVIIRDRNHPCLVMWGVLNENSDGPVFRKAVELLPSLRRLDSSRLFVLNSGRFDGAKEIGSMSNPGSDVWDVGFEELKDWHPYVWIPYCPEVLDMLSGKTNKTGQKCYISETGLCFPIDLPSELGDYQLAGRENSDDALYYRRQYDKFLADWERFKMGECWSSQSDYIRDAYRTAASIREIAESAIRSNQYIVSYTPTNGVADAVAGESMATNFRRIKPDLIAPVLESNEKLRWCLRTEPQSIYSGDSIWFSVSLSDLDVLPEGIYHANLMALDPSNNHLADRKIVFSVKGSGTVEEYPFARELFSEKFKIDSPAGRCKLIVSLEKGATIRCGEISFYVSERNGLPSLPSEVTLTGNDQTVSEWLSKHGVKIKRLADHPFTKRELILVTGNVPDSLGLSEVAERMARGSTVFFLSPSSFGTSRDKTKWLPLEHKGSLEPMDAVAGYYRADRWLKRHPFSDGMPSGGMMDYVYFRNLISQDALSQEYTVVAKSVYTYDEVSSPLDYPEVTICGATRISHNYCSGIHLGIWNFFGGRFIVNTLHVAENLGHDPAADLFFSNILKYGASELERPVAPIPSDFNLELLRIGYKK